jgi:hypothetical protein
MSLEDLTATESTTTKRQTSIGALKAPENTGLIGNPADRAPGYPPGTLPSEIFHRGKISCWKISDVRFDALNCAD